MAALCPGICRPYVMRSERLDALMHLVERVIKLAVLSDAATKDGFQVCEIGDVDHLVNAMHERAERVVGRKAMTQQNDKVLPALCVGSLHELLQNRVCLER